MLHESKIYLFIFYRTFRNVPNFKKKERKKKRKKERRKKRNTHFPVFFAASVGGQ